MITIDDIHQHMRRTRLIARRRLVTAAKQSDDARGVQWWNALTDQQRKRWMRAAGNTGRAKDAWEAFKANRGECNA